jgi:outer membrane protein OmpA-like peptidoglycan-associated protein
MKFALLKVFPTLVFLFFCSSFSFSQANIRLSDFYAAGDAVIRGEECFQLTYDQNWSAGSIWYKEAIDLSRSFEMELELMMGRKDRDGADGIVFIFHSERIRLGYAGEGMGFAGLVPSIGIEVDTWENGHLLDPAEDHIAILKNGSVAHFNNLAGPVKVANVEDGRNHKFKIIWDAVAQELSIYLDGSKRLSAREDIVRNIFGGNSKVYWGISSATGRWNNSHEVCLKKLEFDIAIGSLFDDPRVKPKLMKGEIGNLRSVSFPSGRSNILPSSFEELDQLAAFLKANPNLTVEIGGHTDSSGDRETNRKISKLRADAVAQYLRRKGIPLKRMYTRGYGEDFPIANNTTENGRKRNRRVAIRVFKPLP